MTGWQDRVLVALALTVACVVLFLMAGGFLEGAQRPKRIARLKCRQQLKQLRLYLDMYAGEHDGVYPPAIEPLVDGPLMLRCPGREAWPHVNPHPGDVYVYVGAGLRKDALVDPHLTPVLFDRTPIHLHTRNVVTADGRVRPVDEDEFRSLVEGALAREKYSEDAVRQMREILAGEGGG